MQRVDDRIDDHDILHLAPEELKPCYMHVTCSTLILGKLQRKSAVHCHCWFTLIIIIMLMDMAQRLGTRTLTVHKRSRITSMPDLMVLNKNESHHYIRPVYISLGSQHAASPFMLPRSS